MAKNNEKLHAIELRQKGYSLSYISSKIAVSRATLSHWLRDIPYTPNDFTLEHMQKARSKSAVSRNRMRLEKIAEFKKASAGELGEVGERDLFMIGLGLLAKTGRVTGGSSMSGGASERIELITADAKLARLFSLWITRGLKISTEHIFIRLMVSPTASSERSLQFWAEATKIPKGQIKVAMVGSKKSTSSRLSSAPLGSVKIYLKGKGRIDLGVLLHRKILASIDRVLEI